MTPTAHAKQHEMTDFLDYVTKRETEIKEDWDVGGNGGRKEGRKGGSYRNVMCIARSEQGR